MSKIPYFFRSFFPNSQGGTRSEPKSATGLKYIEEIYFQPEHIIEDNLRKTFEVLQKEQTRDEKLENLIKTLNQANIDTNALRSDYFEVSNDAGCKYLRPIIWRLLLGYLPPDSNKWKESMELNKEMYENYIQKFKITRKEEAVESIHADHPLSKEKDSYWNNYFNDLKLWDEIERDAKRTKKTVVFFRSELIKNNEYPNLKPPEHNIEKILELEKEEELHEQIYDSTKQNASEKKELGEVSVNPSPLGESEKVIIGTFENKGKYEEVVPLEDQETQCFVEYARHIPQASEKHEAPCDTEKNVETEPVESILARILFVYAKKNPKLGYVQGMNNILAPLLFVFGGDENETFKFFAESDAFTCFSLLMTDLFESFMQPDFRIKEDECKNIYITGMERRIAHFHEMLKKIEFKVWKHLEENRIDPNYFTMRWLLLFFTQDFQFETVVVLWDKFISHLNRIEYVNFFGIAILGHLREKILKLDFGDTISLLQNLEGLDVKAVIRMTNSLYRIHAGKGVSQLYKK